MASPAERIAALDNDYQAVARECTEALLVGGLVVTLTTHLEGTTRQVSADIIIYPDHTWGWKSS